MTYKVMLQSVIGFLNDVRIVGITQAVPELLRLDRFQLLLEPCELILKADGGVFCFGEQCFFLGNGFLQVVHHPSGIVAHLPDGVLDGGVEAGNFRVMAGAAV